MPPFKNDPAGTEEPDSLFPESRWTLVINAQSGPDQLAKQALDDLCKLYWQPIYSYIRRHGCTSEEAEDLTQGYFESLLERNYLSRASRDKGKLRAFLLADVKLYLSNERRRTRSQKRGGGRLHVRIDRQWAEDSLAVETGDASDPAMLFDRRWALTLLGKVMGDVRSVYVSKGREELFDALKQFVSWNSGEESYSEVARRIGRDENYVKQSVFRLRKLYRKTLEAEVAHTVSSAENVEEEIRHLASCLC
jgi:RNA polymerase sigma-70 factor (ECF subfamily)